MPKFDKSKIQGLGKYLLSVVILVGAFSSVVGMYSMRKEPEESSITSLQQVVSVFPAKQFDDQLEIQVSGIVEAHREIEIAAEVTGKVVTKTDQCRAGRFVKKDTLLIEIDSEPYRLAMNRAQSEIDRTNAQIKEWEQEVANLKKSIGLAQDEYDLQAREYQRKMRAGAALSLSERDQAERNIKVAERQLTELKNSLDLSQARKPRLDAAVQVAETQKEEAKLNVDRCVLRAPFDGVIVSDPVEKEDFLTPGKTMLVFEDTSAADVKCNLRFEQLQQIIKYQVNDSRVLYDPNAAYQIPATDVKIVMEIDGQQVVWDGLLDRFDGIGVDVQTKMIPCRVIVTNPVNMETGRPRALVRGMFVKVKIPLDVYQDEGESLLTFPATAIRPGNYVWSVVDGKLQRHKVKILDRKNMDAEDPLERMIVAKVSSELLQEGSSIVVSPLAQPNPGTEVEVVQSSAAKDSGKSENSSDFTESTPSSDTKASGTKSTATPAGDSVSVEGEQGAANHERTNVRKPEGATRS